MRRIDGLLALTGLAATLATLNPVEAAVADPAHRPIARIDQIRMVLLQAADVNADQDRKSGGVVAQQWFNWRNA